MEFVGTQPIRTERLFLRRFRVEDAREMYDNWAGDKNVTRYLTWKAHRSVEETKAVLTIWCRQYDRTDTYNWAIEYEGTLIGNISVIWLNESSEWVELGYCMAAAYWNLGLMTEAVNAVADWLFSEVDINRVCIRHATKNLASGRVAQKCGFTFEGTTRESYRTPTGEFLDVSIYSLLRREWEERR